MTIQEARAAAELKIGKRLDEQEFQEILAYTKHKAKVTGHDEDYVPLLLMDEIKDSVFRDTINEVSRQAKLIEQELIAMIERGEWLCAKSVSPIPA